LEKKIHKKYSYYFNLKKELFPYELLFIISDKYKIYTLEKTIYEEEYFNK